MRLIRGGKWMNLDDMNRELAEYFDQDDEVVEVRHAAIDRRAEEIAVLRALIKKKAHDREKRREARQRRKARLQAERDRMERLSNAS